MSPDDFMKDWKRTLAEERDDAFRRVPSMVETMIDLLAKEFSYTTPHDARTADRTSTRDLESVFKELVVGRERVIPDNQNMVKLVSKVRNEVTPVVNALRALERWAKLQARTEGGKESSGGARFEASKEIQERMSPVEENLDTFPEYFKSRAEACDKIDVNIFKMTTASTSSLRDARHTDRDYVQSSRYETRTMEAGSTRDWSEYLEALDRKWFVLLHHTVEKARDALVFAYLMTMENYGQPKVKAVAKYGKY